MRNSWVLVVNVLAQIVGRRAVRVEVGIGERVSHYLT